tara:strand:+ start:279 stop:488 length:210 start_codon:yes stop_codon:yes gene_type:complete
MTIKPFVHPGKPKLAADPVPVAFVLKTIVVQLKRAVKMNMFQTMRVFRAPSFNTDRLETIQLAKIHSAT